MPESCGQEVCSTCADQLIAVQVESLSSDGLTAFGIQAGERAEIAIDLLEDVHVGDTLLVHGGVALQLATPIGVGHA